MWWASPGGLQTPCGRCAGRLLYEVGGGALGGGGRFTLVLQCGWHVWESFQYRAGASGVCFMCSLGGVSVHSWLWLEGSGWGLFVIGVRVMRCSLEFSGQGYSYHVFLSASVGYFIFVKEF